MVLFQHTSDLYGGRIFSLGLLMVLIAACVPNTTGQEVGVSLKMHGVTIPNNSLVDLDDVLYTAPYPCCNTNPSNSRSELHDGALLCVTDLEDCCDTPRTVRGDWYYPDGRTVLTGNNINAVGPGPAIFLINRGPNEIINGRQFYGSVRLYRRWSGPPERGHFRCELPSAANSSVNQILYVNIVQFGNSSVKPVNISSSGPGIAGTTFSLTCSVTLTDPIPLPANVPCPNFEWFYGPNGIASLPPGVIPEAKFNFSGHTFTSTLQFTPGLNESHAGNYTCRLGAGRLANSIVVSVHVAILQVTTSGVPMVGQSSYALTCKALLADHLCPFVSYRWTKENGTITQPAKNDTITFSPLRLSDAGRYTCQAKVYSIRFTNEVTLTESHEIRVQIPPPTSVIISASSSNPVRPVESAVNLTCTLHLELSPQANTPMVLNIVWTGLTVGFTTINTLQPILGSSTTYTSTAMVSSFGRNESGIYTCRASLSSSSINLYISNSTAVSNSIKVTTGVYLALRNQFIANNTQINIRSIGLSSDNSNGALQCITDSKPCCFSQEPRLGWWYQPDGMLVHLNTSGVVLHRGDNGEVYLNRPSSASVSPTGRFCCVVPDATNTNQTLCVIIGKVSLTAQGSPIAGESYSLECSAGESTATFQWWLGPPGGKRAIANSGTIIISSNSSMSRLQFQPVQQSHSGIYSCHATTDEETLSSEPIEIHVNVPSIAISVTTNDNTSGIAGESYSLNCNVLGTENLHPSITYQWMKNTSSGQIPVGTNSRDLLFSPVRLSDAANYSCMVTIASGYLITSVTAMASQSIRIQIPASSTITLKSNVANHSRSSILIIGSDVKLTCTVELNSAILGFEIILLMVSAQMYKDDGTSLALTDPIVTGSTFTYTTQLKSFERNDFGNYTCIATIRPRPISTHLTGTSTILSDSLIIEAVILPPVHVQATQSSPSAPVEVSWSPPSESAQGAFKISEYRIFYGSGQNVSIPSVLITSVSFRVNGRFDGQTIAIRSESSQLFSELVNVTVEKYEFCTVRDMTKCSYMCSCASKIGAAIGVMVVVMAIIAGIIIVAFCWWRKSKKDIEVSVNVAYQDTTWKSEDLETEREYESIDMIVKSTQQQLAAEKTASEYTDIQEAMSSTNTIQQP